MLAILFGLATACLWATTLLVSARSSRLIGVWSTLAWVMLVGLVLAVPLVLASPPATLTGEATLRLGVAGVANVVGLVFVYTALRRGKVAVVGPIVSTEGAIAAVLAILAGDPVTAATIAVLAVIAIGVVLAANEAAPDPPDDPAAPLPEPPATGAPSSVVTVALAIAGALFFGIGLFATSRIAADLPPAWAALPARLIGFVAVTLPLVLTRRARLTRPAVPLVIVIGVAEVLGFITFALGARESAAITSVIASQFAAIAAVVAYLLFGERLRRVQVVGIAVIAVGVAVLAAVQA